MEQDPGDACTCAGMCRNAFLLYAYFAGWADHSRLFRCEKEMRGMKTKSVLLIVVVLLAGALVPMAHAQAPGMGRGRGRGAEEAPHKIR